MSNTETSIFLLSPTQAVFDEVDRAVAAIPGAALKSQRSSLVEVNGHAAELAAGSDIVMVETGLGQEKDLNTIRALVNAKSRSGILVALTDGDVSLSNAKMLKNAGVDEIVPLPCTQEEIAELLRKVVQSRSAPLQTGGAIPHAGRLIAVTGARGGIGATTIAVNLAHLLQDRRGLVSKKPTRRVAIVDLELQFGDVGILLDVEDRGAMLDLVRSDAPPDREFVRTAMTKRKCGLSVLPAAAEPIPLDALDRAKVAALLDALRAEYDFVVVDMPKALVDWISPVLGRAEKLLVATDTSVPGVRHARRLIDFYAEENPALAVEVVIVNEKRGMFMSGQQKEAARVLERPLEHWLPHDGRSAVEATDKGEPLVALRGGSELSKALRKLARSITKAQPQQSLSATH